MGGGSRCKTDWNEFQIKSNKRQFYSRVQASKAYALWKKQDWAALEKFMGDGAWLPNRGFITATKTTLKLAQRLTATVVGPMQMVSTIVILLDPLRYLHSRGEPSNKIL